MDIINIILIIISTITCCCGYTKLRVDEIEIEIKYLKTRVDFLEKYLTSDIKALKEDRK